MPGFHVQGHLSSNFFQSTREPRLYAELVHSIHKKLRTLEHMILTGLVRSAFAAWHFKGAVPLETAALNRREWSYAMYLFLVVCSMYAYFVVAVETDTNRQFL